ERPACSCPDASTCAYRNTRDAPDTVPTRQPRLTAPPAYLPSTRDPFCWNRSRVPAPTTPCAAVELTYISTPSRLRLSLTCASCSLLMPPVLVKCPRPHKRSLRPAQRRIELRDLPRQPPRLGWHDQKDTDRLAGGARGRKEPYGERCGKS